MSMDNDTRLAMMAMNNTATRRAPRARRARNTASGNLASATAAAMATFALTLFTRGA